MHKFRVSLDKPNLPTIPVISPQPSPTKNSYSSPNVSRQKRYKEGNVFPFMTANSDCGTMRTVNNSLILSLDETSNKENGGSDNSIQISPTSPFFFNSERYSRSMTLSDNSSTEQAIDDQLNTKARTSVAKVRKRAKFYKHRRGSSLFSPPSPLTDQVLQAMIPKEGKESEETEEEDVEEDEEYIEKVIIVQSIVRRFLVYSRIKRKEKMRIKDRQKLEEELNDRYNKEIERIKLAIEQHLPCKEYEDTVDLFNQYVNDIERNEICTDDQEEKLKYLFYICSVDTSKSLNLNEFLVLTNEIMNLSTPDYSYILLFPDELSRVEFVPFLLWYKTSKEKGVAQNNFVYINIIYKNR